MSNKITRGLTPEQLEKAKAAKSPIELVAIARDAGIEVTIEQAMAFLNPPVGELTDEELENVAGGTYKWEAAFDDIRPWEELTPQERGECPECFKQGKSVKVRLTGFPGPVTCTCPQCGYSWMI